ncbi:AsmA family protein [Halomonas sp. 328]|uniref:AsmA family protein n=1 Tax=Halomonas sp. 328 TaxID=2776704 RepID=UPI0018A7581F|nr:AsmA family protein [Halomonas sp. 328]MBF8222905.1 AsmA family protein [Halomonas sp. 328]
MRALLRALLAVVGVLGLVMVAAVIYVTTFFDPNDLKPRLIQVVRDQSGLELALEGPLSWSFYPRLGVSVSEAEAWLPEQALEEEPFVAFAQAEVSLAFTPLLRGMIAIEGLTLDGMRLNLERDAEGRGNWETLLERLDGEEAAERVLAPAAAGVAPGEAGMAVALNIASVQLRDGRVRFEDHQQGLHLYAEALQITGTQVNPSRAFPLRSGFTLRTYPQDHDDETPPLYTSEVGFDGRVRLGLADGRYRLEDASLTTRTELAELAGHRQRLDLRLAELVAEPAQGRYSAEGGQLELGLSHPELGASPLSLSLGFVADADLGTQEIMLRDLQLEGPDGLRLNGNLTASQVLESPRYTGQVRLAPLSLRPWLNRFDLLPETRDDNVFADVALTSPLRGDPSRLELTNLTLVLDGATFTGRLGAQLDGSALGFELQGDRFDLDRYLPPDTVGEAQAALPGVSAAHAEGEEAGGLSLEWLQGLSLDGQLALGQLKAFALELDEVRLALAGEGQRHRLERLEARLYDGTLEASGALDQSESPVRWSLTPQLARVQVAPVYRALLDEASPLRGRLSLEGELTTRGERIERWPNHLNGQLALRIQDGAMLDVNVSREMCELVAALEGRQSERQWSDDTRFERIQASLTIRDGVVHNDDLDIAVPGIALGGEGELNLVTRRFDYAARARFVDGADAACPVNPRLERVPLPVRCVGSLDEAPGDWCGFDRSAFRQVVGELVRDEATERASREVERRLDDATRRLEERLGEGAGEELRDTLRGLFN